MNYSVMTDVKRPAPKLTKRDVILNRLCISIGGIATVVFLAAVFAGLAQ